MIWCRDPQFVATQRKVKGREYEEGTLDSRRVCFVVCLFFFFGCRSSSSGGGVVAVGFFFFPSLVRVLFEICFRDSQGHHVFLEESVKKGKERKGSGVRARSFL